MQTILRPKFPDTPLDASLLEAVAGLWLDWHVRNISTHFLPRHSFHRVEAHLWGVPRPDIEVCRTRLARLASRELPDAAIELSDPETLCVTSPWRDIAQPAALVRVARLFAEEEFEGMRLTLRLSAGEWRGTPDGRPLKEGTLVLWTELRDGVPRLKGTWPGDLSGRGETPFHFAHWSDEPDFWQSVNAFRDGDLEAPRFAKPLFISPARQQFRRASRWLQVDVGEQRTLAAFLVRVATFGSVAAITLGAVWSVGTPLAIVLGAPLGLLAFRWFAETFFKKLKSVAKFHHRMQARLRSLYTQPLNFLPVNLPQVSPWPEVSTAKYTREAEQSGCVHWRDIRRDQSTDIVSFVRVFAIPAERTYVFLTLLHGTGTLRHSPVKAWFMVSTYFADGTQLLLTNEHGGYIRWRDSLAIQRFFPEVKDVRDLLEIRRSIAQRLLGEGKELAPLMSVDELLARMEADHVKIGELARRMGYFTWGAALRQSFDLIRREYRSRK